jgi:hypothetical protein
MAGAEVAAVQAAQALAKTKVQQEEIEAKVDLPRPLVFRAAGALFHSSQQKKDEKTLRVSVMATDTLSVPYMLFLCQIYLPIKHGI